MGQILKSILIYIVILLLGGVICIAAFLIACGGISVFFTRDAHAPMTESFLGTGLMMIPIALLSIFGIFWIYLRWYIFPFIGVNIVLVFVLGNVYIFTGGGPVLQSLEILGILFILFSCIIFHFYRMKSMAKSGNSFDIFTYIKDKFSSSRDSSKKVGSIFLQGPHTQDTTKEKYSPPLSPESVDLMNSLQSMSIVGISSVHFFIRNGVDFRIQTHNIIGLAKYITEKMGKNEFEPHELDTAFSYVSAYIQSDLSEEEKNKVSILLKGFVENGGKVEFIS